MPEDAPSARRTELVEAAYAYALEHGLAGASLRPVAEAIGSSTGVLRFLFGSKDGLVRAILARARRDELDALTQLPTDGDLRQVSLEVWSWLADPGHAAVLRIRQGRRMMVDGKASQTSPILESDRDIAGGDGRFRSLQPDSTDVTLNAVYARPFDNGVSASVNGTFEDTSSKSRLGLSPLGPEALTRRARGEDARLAGSSNGAIAGWQWSVTGSAEREASHSSTCPL